MWTRILLIGAILIGGGWVASPPVQAGCLVDSGTYTTGTVLREPLCDTSGNLKTTLGGSSSGGLGTANAAAPTLVEAASATFSFDLSGNVRMTMGTLLSCEDQANNLCMVSGGAVRLTQLVGTGGVPSTATDATGTANLLPTGVKNFHGIVTCTGTCVQTQKIYASYESSATVAKSILVCTLTISGTTTATDYCKTDFPASYWFVVTSATSGTTPLAGLFVQY